MNIDAGSIDQIKRRNVLLEAQTRELRQELERMRRENAKMREALELTWKSVKYRGASITLSPSDHIAIRDAVEAALAPDAGADLLTREHVQPLVWHWRDVLRHPDAAHTTLVEHATKALTHARSLGFEI